MTDWAWKYAEWGSAAVLTVGAVDYPITAVDHTSGVTVLDGVQTVDPQAEIQAADLAALGLAKDDIEDDPNATLELNGTTWRITSVQPLPTTQGEADGEYLLLLQATA